MARRDFVVSLLKRETTYSLDAAPDAAAPADVIVWRDCEIEPVNADVVERPRLLPWHGHRGAHGLTRRTLGLSGNVPISCSGAAGTAPPLGKILRACGMAETVTAGTQVRYTPVSAGQEAYSIAYFMDGTRHRGQGARGTFGIEVVAGEEPRLSCSLMAVNYDASGQTLPAASYTAWRPALEVRSDNCTFLMGGHALALQRFVYTHGNQLARRDMPGAAEVRITDRQPRLEVTVQAPDGLSPVDFFGVVTSMLETNCDLIVGNVGGDRMHIQCDRLRPEPGVRYAADGDVAMLTMAFRVRPSAAGNDEVAIRFF